MAINQWAGGRKPDRRKSVLVGAAVAVIMSVLFPPWIYTFDRLSTSDRPGGHCEVSAGYAPLFKPPNADFGTTNVTIPDYYQRFYNDFDGLKLDLSRLLVEWVGILAVSGVAWGLAQLNRQRPADAVAGPETP
jgi:hypothetical protein